MSRRKMAVVIALVVIPVLLTLAYLYHRAKSVKVWDITFSAVPERTEWQADGGVNIAINNHDESVAYKRIDKFYKEVADWLSGFSVGEIYGLSNSSAENTHYYNTEDSTFNSRYTIIESYPIISDTMDTAEADRLYDKFQKDYYNALLDYGAVKNENEFYNEMHKMTSYIAREFNANNPSVTFENLPKKDQKIVVMTWFAEAGLYRKLAEDRLNHTDSWRKTYE